MAEPKLQSGVQQKVEDTVFLALFNCEKVALVPLYPLVPVSISPYALSVITSCVSFKSIPITFLQMVSPASTYHGLPPSNWRVGRLFLPQVITMICKSKRTQEMAIPLRHSVTSMATAYRPGLGDI